ncbi:MAG: hypothetical protein GF331_21800 [Chitinivibrionales bacterium]|nr:hypothetical protein [Chitinivibrionales bacterium]
MLAPRLFRSCLCLASLAAVAVAAPTDNPLASYYGPDNGYPTWTDEIRWSTVVDMSRYDNGATDFERFENARDSIHALGGGVLYYPTGVYTFDGPQLDAPDGRGLMLKTGVVIRGDAPGADKDASDGTLELGTQFVFVGTDRAEGVTPRHWSLVGITPAAGESLHDVDRVGIVWVELNRATVYFGPNMEWGATYDGAGAWKSGKVIGEWARRVPDGTHPCDPFCGAPLNTSRYLGAGRGRLVFGCRLNNAVVINDFIDEGFGPGGYHSFKYGGRIQVYGSCVAVMNNVVATPTEAFRHTQTTSEGAKEIIFDHAYATGIDINKDYSNVNVNKFDPDGGYWHEGVVVQDNWVYNHGFKGFNLSGTWVTVRGNRNDHDYNNPGDALYGLGEGWTLTGDGYKTHADIGSSDAFQSRAFDLAGRALWVHENWYARVGTPYPSNDGEGILCQAHGGTQLYSWAVTANTGESCQGNGRGYIAGYDVAHHGCLTSWNTTPGIVGSINNKVSGLWDCAFVENTASEVKASAAAGQPSDVLTSCPSATPAPPADVSATAQSDHVLVSWTDASSSEIGYRVERRTQTGSWSPVAYRPRHSQGTEHNVQAWADYLAPSGRSLYYRVVAIGCGDTDDGASSETGPVQVDGGMTVWAPWGTAKAVVPPVGQCRIYDLRGRVLPGTDTRLRRTGIRIRRYPMNGSRLELRISR